MLQVIVAGAPLPERDPDAVDNHGAGSFVLMMNAFAGCAIDHAIAAAESTWPNLAANFAGWPNLFLRRAIVSRIPRDAMRHAFGLLRRPIGRGTSGTTIVF